MNEIESKAIDAAYGEEMKDLIVVLVDNYIEAAGSAIKEKAAEEEFKRGIALVRRVRDRTVDLLGT